MANRSRIKNSVSSNGHRCAENDEGSTELHIIGDDSDDDSEEACGDVWWCGENLGGSVGIPKLIDNLEGMFQNKTSLLGPLTIGMKRDNAKAGITIAVKMTTWSQHFQSVSAW
jgi:hypothetical protein